MAEDRPSALVLGTTETEVNVKEDRWSREVGLGRDTAMCNFHR